MRSTIQRLSLCLLLVAACGARPAVPPPRTAPAHPELAATIDALAAEAIAKGSAPGISIAVVWRGETIVAKGYGLADIDHHSAVAADTVFRVGSISKQFAAAAILRLAAAGKLALDDELTRYLPDYPVHGRKITLRHLLTHTSGIADYEHGPWLQAHMSETRPIAELVASFAAAPFDFEPGTSWSYSNSGYFLLGQIIEKLAQRPFGAEVESMLASAGVAGVRYCPDEQDYPHAAHGYQLVAGKPTAPRAIKMMYATAAGAMCATASGLVTWMQALAHGTIVDDAAWRAMTTPVALAGGRQYDYGFGLFVGALGAHRSIFHSGGINGFAAKLAYYPDDDLYVAVLVNAESAVADELAEATARAILGVPRPEAVDLPIDAAEAAAVVGRYAIAAVGVTIVIEADAGALYVHQDGETERTPLRRQPDGSYVVGPSDMTIVFVRDATGVIGLDFSQGGMKFPGNRLP